MFKNSKVTFLHHVRAKSRTTHAPKRLMFLLLFALVSSVFITRSSATVADSPGLSLIYNEIGNIGFVAQGIGTRGDPLADTWTGSGDIVLSIPDTATIKHARLVWTGRTVEQVDGATTYDSDGLQLGVDNGSTTTVRADKQYFQNPWFKDPKLKRQVEQIHESADILGLVQPGTHTYNISDHEHGFSAKGSPGSSLNYGVGIWVIYEDASEPYGEVVIHEGQDSFFRFFKPPAGPDSNIQCATFEPDSIDRTVQITHFVSGVDLIPDLKAMEPRSNAFWYLTGTNADPMPSGIEPGLFDTQAFPTAVGYVPPNRPAYPLQSRANLEWDNFELQGGVTIPASNSWICMQIESGDSQGLSGFTQAERDKHYPASGMWNFFAIKLALRNTTAVELTNFSGNHVGGLDVALSWQTETEIDNFGFNLYRSADSNLANATQLNSAIIPSAGSSGAAYSFTDTVPGYGLYWYWLEDVDTTGDRSTHDPIPVMVSLIKNIYLPLINR